MPRSPPGHTAPAAPKRSSRGGGAGAPVLSAAYLQKHTSKNDLVRRLRTVGDALSDDAVEPNSPEYPGLEGLAAVLVDDRYLNHRDKDVRLHTVLACVEIFYLYAPEPPWDESEILKVFSQMIRQLANLSHCTSPAQTNYNHYFHLLEQLSVVKIGVVLVELTKTLESNLLSPDGLSPAVIEDGETSKEEATEMLCELIRTILHCVSIDHSQDVSNHAVAAISACLEEMYNNVPVPVLDEILTPISAGPVVYVTNPAAVEAAAAIAEAKKKRGKGKGKQQAADVDKMKMPPMQIQQTNQSYMVAASIIRRTEDRISTGIANLLNGILNGDPNYVEQTNITSGEVGAAAASAKAGTGAAAPAADVWAIIYELHKVSPQVLTTVIGTIASSLQSPNVDMRLRVTKLLGRLFYSTSSNIATKFRPCYREWLRRSGDADVKVRLSMAKLLTSVMANKSHERELCEEAAEALDRMVRHDPANDVRLLCVHNICDLAHNERSASGGQGGSSAGGGRGGGSGDSGNSGSSSANGGGSSSASSGPVVPADLLQSVGNRVRSKNKAERRDAITGLAQIYYRHYASEKLRLVQAGGDDCDIDVILDVLHDTCHSAYDEHGFGGAASVSSKRKGKAGAPSRRRGRVDGGGSHSSDLYDIDEKYRWIPRLVFESACFTDATDPDMRNRVIQIVDDVLLGSDRGPSGRGGGDGGSSSGGGKKQPLSPTSRAVGLAVILHSLRDEGGGDGGTGASAPSNAYRWMRSLLTQRAQLQRALGAYIDARTRMKKYDHGSEEALTADAEAMGYLETVATLTAPVPQSSSSSSPSDIPTILKNLHTARDKHIFRILATIATPTHSPSARARAFDELPKRTKSLGNATASWVKTLARRCAMGAFVNKEIVMHCILLAQECLHEGDVESTMVFLRTVKTAVSIYPALGASKEAFESLVEMFGACQATHSGKMKKQIKAMGVVSALITILAEAAPSRSGADVDQDGGGTEEGSQALEPNVQDLLLRLCRDGTADQARHAVFTMAALANPNAEVAGGVVSNSDAGALQREKAVFEPLLKALTSPSRMAIAAKGSSGSGRIVSILAALAAVAEYAPSTFSSAGGRGEKAIKFALESVLLGRIPSNADEESDVEKTEDDSSDEEEEEESPSASMSRRRSSHGRRASGKHGSPKKGNASGGEKVSVAAQRACAAMDLLAAHIRSNIGIRRGESQRGRGGNDKENDGAKKRRATEAIQYTSDDHISVVFSTLIQILRDSGLPPSNRDRRDCKSSSDRATMRKSAAVNLLRLCAPALQLEDKHLSNNGWQVLSTAFLDEEKVVREAVMVELSNMLLGSGKYGHKSRAAPSLRFLSFVVLCADGEHSHSNSSANGSAANVGKLSGTTKMAASQCISLLRGACENTLAQCRASGREAEQNFETYFKMRLMPEFAVPYALHLLAFRRETPSAGGTEAGAAVGTFSADPNADEGDDEQGNEDAIVADEEARQKVLRKRLKWLMEPLVQSLGEGADNISFLLRMTELLGNRYQPVDVSRELASVAPQSPSAETSFETVSSLGISLEESMSNHPIVDTKRSKESHAKLKIICSAAREVLLKFVKKDINLTPYPGKIHFPGSLFARAPTVMTRTEHQPSESTSPFSLAEKSTTSRTSYASASGKTRRSATKRDAENHHVHFSPELEQRREYHESDDDGGAGFMPGDDDDYDDDVGMEEDQVASSTARTKRKGSSATRKALESPPTGGNLPLSTSPNEPADSNDSFGGMSPIAQSDSPSSSLASTSKRRPRRRGTRHTTESPQYPKDSKRGAASGEFGSPFGASPEKIASPSSTPSTDGELQSSQSTIGDSHADAAPTPPSEKSRKSARKNNVDTPPSSKSGGKRPSEETDSVKRGKKKRASPVQINMGRTSTDVTTAKRKSTRKRTTPPKKEQISGDELDFDEDPFDLDDDEEPSTKSGRRIAVSMGKKSRNTKKSGGKAKKAAPARKTRPLSKSSLQNNSSPASTTSASSSVRGRRRRVRG